MLLHHSADKIIRLEADNERTGAVSTWVRHQITRKEWRTIWILSLLFFSCCFLNFFFRCCLFKDFMEKSLRASFFSLFTTSKTRAKRKLLFQNSGFVFFFCVVFFLRLRIAFVYSSNAKKTKSLCSISSYFEHVRLFDIERIEWRNVSTSFLSLTWKKLWLTTSKLNWIVEKDFSSRMKNPFSLSLTRPQFHGHQEKLI